MVYQNLDMRLNTGLLSENPVELDTFEGIQVIGGGDDGKKPSNHAHVELSILYTIINQANYIIINHWDKWILLNDLCKKAPNSINIF